MRRIVKSKTRDLMEDRMKHKDFWAKHFAEYYANLLSIELHKHAYTVLHDNDCSHFVTKTERCDCSLLVIIDVIKPPLLETE